MSKNPDKKKREQKKHMKSLRRRRRTQTVADYKEKISVPMPMPAKVKFVDSIPGLPKMSEQLNEFIEPYFAYVDSYDAYHKLLTVAMVAWNLAVTPAEMRPKLMASLLKKWTVPTLIHSWRFSMG